MNNFFSILIFYFFIASCASPSWVRESGRRAPIESFVFIKATVKLQRCASIDSQSICTVEIHGSTASGISIGNIGNSSVILTAGHLCEVDSASLPPDVQGYKVEIEVYNYRGRSKVGKIIKSIYKDPDMCSILVKDFMIPGVKFSMSAPEVGERVYALSAPVGIFHPPAVPILEGLYSGDRFERDFSIVTIRATGGSSGSGILNERMELIGILFATHPAFNSVTLISTYSLTRKFIFDTLLQLKVMR